MLSVQTPPLPVASVDQKLVTQLACLRCARKEAKQSSWEDSHRDILWKAIHHSDEQVVHFPNQYVLL